MNVLVIGSSLFDVIVSMENNPHVKIMDKNASFVLGDKIPIDIKAFAIGGNAPNVSSALHKLAVPNIFYTYLGEDALSIFIKNRLTQEGINIVYENTKSQTGPLSLIFDFLTDRTIFSHHPQTEHNFDVTKINLKPDCIFLTSLGNVWEGAYEQILSYSSSQNIPIAFSPGSQQMKNINETFIKTVHQAKMLFCNMEEAKIINQKLSGNEISDPKELLLNIKNNGFELLSVTDGGNGSYAVDKNSTVYRIGTIEPDGHEKTGAGDAYAGAFLASYLQGKDIPECMKRGVLNSVGVMSHIGAHTGQLTAEQMDEKAAQTVLDAQII